MSKFEYDPDDMFPKKRKPKSIIESRAMRWLIIIALAAIAIICSTGCINMSSIKELELDLSGLEIEWYPRVPEHEESIFGGKELDAKFKVESVPARLMNRNK